MYQKILNQFAKFLVLLQDFILHRSMLTQIGRQTCVFTFGYGGEHDASMLRAIADAGSGLFYYIDNIDCIPDSFCDCLGGLLSVSAQVFFIM